MRALVCRLQFILLLLFYSSFSFCFNPHPSHPHVHTKHQNDLLDHDSDTITGSSVEENRSLPIDDEATSLAPIPVNGRILPRELLLRADSDPGSSGIGNSGQSSSSNSVASSSGDYTCGPNKPCGNKACCGESGWCGYEPKYCGKGCQSNCDAKAECGKYAAKPGKTCPLNVCCSEYGFCGTTEEFCKKGCQSNCKQPKPSVGKSDVQKKIIAYWEAWNQNKPCGHMSPEEIPVNDITHLIFSFGFITPGDFQITNMADVKPSLFKEITALKDKNPNLSIMIALGGWTHNDPGKYQKVFSDMVSSQANRSKFIKNLLGFLTQYGFDGVDFDWEYPGADDRGGKDSDGKNYTQFLKELRAAIRSSGRNYLVTYTAPTSYWYLRHFDLKAMNDYVDWINLMSYDLHGIWDRDNPIGNQVLGHTNITEIDLALDLFWRNDIPPKDIVLGIGFYGRSFKLENSGCWKPGCRFSDPGDKGKCTNTAGFLSYREIMDLIKGSKAKPVYDKQAKVNYMVYGENNWISYDDERTFKDKIDFANDRGLNGLMMWAIDLDDSKHTALNALTGGKSLMEGNTFLGSSTKVPRSTEAGYSSDDSSQCRVTGCGGYCTQAETLIGRVAGDNNRKFCGGKASNARSICCPAWTSITKDDCRWNRKSHLRDCAGKCDPGEIKLFADKYGWKGDLKDGSYGTKCSRGSAVFCCKAGNMKQYLDICSWTECGGTCPSDKQYVLTVDSGGQRTGGARCNAHTKDNFMGSDFDKDAQDPKKGQSRRRKLCCPKKDSFTNCSWRSAKECSKQCDNGQITLDLDPQGMGGPYCSNGRSKAFCCDAPGRKKQPFLPVDLDKIFPPEYMPPPDSLPQFELTSFGGGVGSARPNDAGVAFFLLAGSSTGLASMSKRDNPNLHFLDCPTDLLKQPKDQHQTARVICTGAVEECFGVTKNGVEGTVVHMPVDCGAGGYARAVSLVPSLNQSIPVELALEDPTSAVYDFTFDYNMGLVRRDAGTFSLRIDYSNTKGYWNAVVNKVGRKKRHLKELVDRFYASNSKEWFTQFDMVDWILSDSLNDNKKSTLDQVVYFDRQSCDVNNKEQDQGLLITLTGSATAKFFYGFSMIATWKPGSQVKVHQSAGFLSVSGDTTAEFTVAGIGNLDSAEARKLGSAQHKEFSETLGGHGLWHGWAEFRPYKQEGVKFQTLSMKNEGVNLNGYLSAKVSAKWGGSNVWFPSGNQFFEVSKPVARGMSGMTPLGKDSPESSLTVAATTKFGLDIALDFGKPYQDAVPGIMPDMSVTQEVSTTFSWVEKDKEVCLKTYARQNQVAELISADYVGWGKDYQNPIVRQYFQVGDKQCFNGKSKRSIPSPGNVLDATTQNQTCDKASEPEDEDIGLVPKKKKEKRQNNSVPDFPVDYSRINIRKIEDLSEQSIDEHVSKKPRISCDSCGSCTLTDSPEKESCCSCVWLEPPEGYEKEEEDNTRPDTGSIPLPGQLPEIPSVPQKRDVDDDPPTAIEERASTPSFGSGNISQKPKKLKFWTPAGSTKAIEVKSPTYPAYPDFYQFVYNKADFDNDPRFKDVKRFYHNKTAVCSSFDVAKFPTYDKIYKYDRKDQYGPYTQGKLYHQHYQTEHVFEGQTISRFFDIVLPLTNPYTHAWSERYAFKVNAEWKDASGKSQAFINTVVNELGSKPHLDRLTVFLTNSNGMKGSLFGGGRSVAPTRFGKLKPGAEQLLMAREVGLIFGYLALDDVWDAFCDAHNGMLTQMEKFDAWYLKETKQKSDLAGLWVKHVRSDLDMVVNRARADIKWMYNAKKRTTKFIDDRWEEIMKGPTAEMHKVKLDKIGKCKKLSATTVGAWKFP